MSDFLNGEDAGHIDLKKARDGSFVGGLFAMYSPSPGNFASLSKQMTGGRHAVPLPSPLPMESGYPEPLLTKLGSANWLKVLERTIG